MRWSYTSQPECCRILYKVTRKGRSRKCIEMYCVRLYPMVMAFLIAASVRDVRGECDMNDDACEFWLEVTAVMTMMDGSEPVYAQEGKLYKYSVPENETGTAVPVDPNTVVVGDGWENPRRVVVANGTMPGPPIQVYENQTVVIHVKNNLMSEGLTIHWHGLFQRNTPWMDGVAMVTMCPILPGSSFTYRFKAYPKGTFWYHSHIGAQLGNGLIGAFIIREKRVQAMEEHIMMIQDWNHDMDSDLNDLKAALGVSFVNYSRIPVTETIDGSQFTNTFFQSGLINGRGRYFAESEDYIKQTPLTVYSVAKGKEYRFRVIGAGMQYPFRVSVDGHQLKLVASDGNDLRPLDVESFVINPGERYDFQIEANQKVDNYWVRAESLEVDVVNHVALAILRYKGAPELDPINRKRPCSATNRCVVFNCPYLYYPSDEFTDCKIFSDAKSQDSEVVPGADGDVEEIFLEFGGVPRNNVPIPTVNGKQMVFPPAPPLTQPKQFNTVCGPGSKCSADSGCTCSFSLDLKHGKSYQIIMTAVGLFRTSAHPIHMHGHAFHVVKMGYATYNHTTARIKETNQDITCLGGLPSDVSLCNNVTWSNSQWGGNNVPGLDLVSAPRKDTIMVPSGGYTVVRIKADNPGVWFMHCHIESHMLGGMALMLNESFDRQPPPPKGFPKCGDFDYNSVEDNAPVSNLVGDGSVNVVGKEPRYNGLQKATLEKSNSGNGDDCIDSVVYWSMFAAGLAIILIQITVISCLLRRLYFIQFGSYGAIVSKGKYQKL